MEYARLPGAVPVTYVAAVIRQDTENGALFALMQSIGGAEPVPAARFDIPTALAHGRGIESRTGVRFFVQVAEENWNTKWGTLHDEFA